MPNQKSAGVRNSLRSAIVVLGDLGGETEIKPLKHAKAAKVTLDGRAVAFA
jgi:hypothetical protein